MCLPGQLEIKLSLTEYKNEDWDATYVYEKSTAKIAKRDRELDKINWGLLNQTEKGQEEI